jgi:uncharacterized protein
MDRKYKKLKKIMASYDRVWVAFSGGVDSTLLLALSRDMLGDQVTAVTVDTSLQAASDLKAAVDRAHAMGVKHILLQEDMLLQEKVRHNSSERCYHCKKAIFFRIKEEALRQGICHIFEGSNQDDIGEYRPGRRALKELGVVSPLQEAGLKKEEIRKLARELGLPEWNKPARPCLATRFPYNETISRKKLQRVQQAEELLYQAGLKQLRVRSHNDLARIEVDTSEIDRFLQPEFRNYINQSFKEIGFTYITLDLQGFRSGSMDVKL